VGDPELLAQPVRSTLSACYAHSDHGDTVHGLSSTVGALRCVVPGIQLSLNHLIGAQQQ